MLWRARARTLDSGVRLRGLVAGWKVSSALRWAARCTATTERERRPEQLSRSDSRKGAGEVPARPGGAGCGSGARPAGGGDQVRRPEAARAPYSPPSGPSSLPRATLEAEEDGGLQSPPAAPAARPAERSSSRNNSTSRTSSSTRDHARRTGADRDITGSLGGRGCCARMAAWDYCCCSNSVLLAVSLALLLPMEPEACAKKLCFEDVSMHQPDVSFHRFQAACAREQPTVSGLRKCVRASRLAPPLPTHAPARAG